MAGDSTTTIVMVLVLVIILCSSCSSSVAVLANENPSFGGSFLDFLRGDWYNNIFGYPVAPPGEYENEGEGVDAGGNGSGDNEDDGDKDNDKDRSKPKDNCVYLYKNKNGKKYLISKCTSSTKTYKGSNVEEVSSIKVGKDLTVYVYDKDNKKKMYKGNKNKTYNLPSKWNDNTRKLVLKHKDGGGSSGGGGSNSGTNGGSSGGNTNSGGVSSTGKTSSGSCTSNVCMYSTLSFGGNYIGFDGESRVYNFNDIKNKGVSKIYSMKIDDDYQVAAYTEPKYNGTKKILTGEKRMLDIPLSRTGVGSFIIQKKNNGDSGTGGCNPYPFGNDTDKVKTIWKDRDFIDGKWQCPSPWYDTRCGSGDGDNELKQCARKQKHSCNTTCKGSGPRKTCNEVCRWANA